MATILGLRKAESPKRQVELPKIFLTIYKGAGTEEPPAVYFQRLFDECGGDIGKLVRRLGTCRTYTCSMIAHYELVRMKKCAVLEHWLRSGADVRAELSKLISTTPTALAAANALKCTPDHMYDILIRYDVSCFRYPFILIEGESRGITGRGAMRRFNLKPWQITALAASHPTKLAVDFIAEEIRKDGIKCEVINPLGKSRVEMEAILPINYLHSSKTRIPPEEKQMKRCKYPKGIIPEQAIWIAADKNGEVFGYTSEPLLDTHQGVWLGNITEFMEVLFTDYDIESGKEDYRRSCYKVR